MSRTRLQSRTAVRPPRTPRAHRLFSLARTGMASPGDTAQWRQSGARAAPAQGIEAGPCSAATGPTELSGRPAGARPGPVRPLRHDDDGHATNVPVVHRTRRGARIPWPNCGNPADMPGLRDTAIGGRPGATPPSLQSPACLPVRDRPARDRALLERPQVPASRSRSAVSEPCALRPRPASRVSRAVGAVGAVGAVPAACRRRHTGPAPRRPDGVRAPDFAPTQEGFRSRPHGPPHTGILPAKV